jgi:hypothetical protein
VLCGLQIKNLIIKFVGDTFRLGARVASRDRALSVSPVTGTWPLLLFSILPLHSRSIYSIWSEIHTRRGRAAETVRVDSS